MRIPCVEFLQGSLVVLAMATLPAVAEAECKPVDGHSQTRIVPCSAPQCTEGRVIGGLQGRLNFTATGLIPSGATGLPTVSFLTGRSVIEAKDGSTLTGIDTGVIDFATGKVATLITWTDGTGRFAGASGRIRVLADVQTDGAVVGDYSGELCVP